MEPTSTARGILRSLSEGIRSLIILDEKLALLGKEGEMTRSELRKTAEKLAELIGKIGEMDRRVSERLAEFDKRLSEFDKRVDMKVDLAIRDQLAVLDPPETARSQLRRS